MLMYTAKRLLAGLITVWFIATATFIAMHQVPGDPLMNDKAVSAEIRKNLERKYGLDKSTTEQYFIFMGNMLQGDFGISFTQQNRKVNDIIRDHFPVSATLGIANAIITESALSFLGLGFPPDFPTWGRLLYDGTNFIQITPSRVIWPGLFIALTVLSGNYIGEGLRDALDPRLRGR